MVPIEVPIHKYFTEPQNYNPVLFFLCFVFLCTGKVLLVRFLASACSDDSCVVIMPTMTMSCAALSLAIAAAIAIWMVDAMCVAFCGFCNSALSRATATAAAIAIMMGYDGVCYVRDKHVAAPMIRLCVLAYGFLYNSDLYR